MGTTIATGGMFAGKYKVGNRASWGGSGKNERVHLAGMTKEDSKSKEGSRV